MDRTERWIYALWYLESFSGEKIPQAGRFPARRVRAVYEQTTDCIDRG
jgi:hypothetical protein